MESARSALAGHPAGLLMLALALGAFSAFDAYLLRVVPAQVPMYAALFVLSTGVVLNMLWTRPVDRRLLGLAIGVVVLFSLTLVRVPSQNVFIPRYVVGDVAVYSLVGIYLAGAAATWNGREWSRVAYLVILLTAFGSMLAATAQVSGRFEAPATLVIAAVGALIFHYRGVRQLLLVVLAGLVVLGAALASGNRTSLGLLLGAVVIGVFCRFRSRGERRPGIGGRPGIRVPVVGATVLLGLIFVVPALGFTLPDDEEEGLGAGVGRESEGSVAEPSRSPRVIRQPPSTTDASLLSRTTEARDVMGEIQDGGAVAIALGFGPGASYVPVHSNINERNLNDHGTIHSVHITPVMLLYRYGLIGVVSFLALIVLAVRAAWFFARPNRQEYGFGEVAIMFSLPLFLVQMLLVNVTVDPVWAYAVAGGVLILRKADSGSELAEA